MRRSDLRLILYGTLAALLLIALLFGSVTHTLAPAEASEDAQQEEPAPERGGRLRRRGARSLHSVRRGSAGNLGRLPSGHLRKAMKRSFPFEFVYQALSLIVSVILVHAIYVGIVRPRADVVLANQTAAMQADPDYVPERSAYVIIRDFEQEACFILMLWAMAIMLYKGLATARENRLLQAELVPVAEGMKILPEDAREYARHVQALPPSQRRALVPRALLASLHRFGATRSIQDVSDTAQATCDAESERLDSELSMVRYIAWAIPSIGFIGTVRGIGEGSGPGTQGGRGRHRGRHPEPGRSLQLDVHRAPDLHRAHVPAASATALAGAAGPRQSDLPGRAPDPPPAGVLTHDDGRHRDPRRRHRRGLRRRRGPVRARTEPGGRPGGDRQHPHRKRGGGQGTADATPHPRRVLGSARRQTAASPVPSGPVHR